MPASVPSWSRSSRRARSCHDAARIPGGAPRRVPRAAAPAHRPGRRVDGGGDCDRHSGRRAGCAPPAARRSNRLACQRRPDDSQPGDVRLHAAIAAGRRPGRARGDCRADSLRPAADHQDDGGGPPWRGSRARGGGPRPGLVPAAAPLPVRAAASALGAGPRAAGLRVGSKNFTEQIILGELVAQQLEGAGLRVERRLNLGGTFICDRALRSGDIDVYVEYTGTADTAVFKNPVETDPARVLERVRQRYADGGLTLLPPLGFENTFAILVRGDEARRLGLKTIEDAAPHTPSWQAGFGYEFLQRADGYPGLSEKYALRFAAAPQAMDLSLLYSALAPRPGDPLARDPTTRLIPAPDPAVR